jgi:hypothetical protein
MFWQLIFICLSIFASGHCIVCPSTISSFWLLLWYLLLYPASDYSCDIFYYIHLLITPVISSTISSFWLLLWYLLLYPASDYSCDIFYYIQLLITPVTSSNISCSYGIYPGQSQHLDLEACHIIPFVHAIYLAVIRLLQCLEFENLSLFKRFSMAFLLRSMQWCLWIQMQLRKK